MRSLRTGFRFRPAWWTPLVSDGWGGFLEQLPAQDRGYCPITRADLLDAAETHGLPQALVASYVWGTGSSAFLVGRRARVVRDNDAQRVDDSLYAVADTLQHGNTVEAYASMLRGGPHKTPRPVVLHQVPLRRRCPQRSTGPRPDPRPVRSRGPESH